MCLLTTCIFSCVCVRSWVKSLLIKKQLDISLLLSCRILYVTWMQLVCQLCAPQIFSASLWLAYLFSWGRFWREVFSLYEVLFIFVCVQSVCGVCESFLLCSCVCLELLPVCCFSFTLRFMLQLEMISGGPSTTRWPFLSLASHTGPWHKPLTMCFGSVFTHSVVLHWLIGLFFFQYHTFLLTVGISTFYCFKKQDLR